MLVLTMHFLFTRLTSSDTIQKVFQIPINLARIFSFINIPSQGHLLLV